MEWIDSVRQALIDLGGSATEGELLELIEKKGYRSFEDSKTPQRSLNMYLNKRLKDEVERIDGYWYLKSQPNLKQNDLKDADLEIMADTIRGIARLENEMKNHSPQAKKRISSFIERGKIAKLVKKYQKFECQVCTQLNIKGNTFLKPNGEFYVETHHVEPVKFKKSGSLGLGNLIVVCANHHRQLHYGNSKLLNNNGSHFLFEIDGLKV